MLRLILTTYVTLWLQVFVNIHPFIYSILTLILLNDLGLHYMISNIFNLNFSIESFVDIYNTDVCPGDVSKLFLLFSSDGALSR